MKAVCNNNRDTISDCSFVFVYVRFLSFVYMLFSLRYINLFLLVFLGVGFTSVPGGSAWSNTSVLAYHYYEPPQLNLAETFWIRKLDGQRLKCATFLTEFDIGNRPGNQKNMVVRIINTQHTSMQK